MTIDEAIEELKDSLDESIPSLRERQRNAIELGIEALNDLKELREILRK